VSFEGDRELLRFGKSPVCSFRLVSRLRVQDPGAVNRQLVRHLKNNPDSQGQ